jgi:hypothetical protein
MSAPRKPAAAANKFWRITKSTPNAERVRKATPDMYKPSKNLPEVSYGTWVTSSYDLADGADVTEIPDTLPAELFDELFPPKPGTPKTPGK